VAAERAAREADALLALKVVAVKRFQHARFEGSYADLLADKRYAQAARFFLEDLYGPTDFTQRDEQFARVVPSLVRIFPKDIVKTVTDLAQLHELSEALDTAMGHALAASDIDFNSYRNAWRSVGRSQDRERQIALMLEIGSALDRFTRNPLVRGSLRLMRAPANAAGLSALQQFLEAGFDSFSAMHGAQHFLSVIAARERELAARLFSSNQTLE
jgi:hypothetical protein